MKPCLSPLSPKCENNTMKKCIFESSLKNTETQQGGLHGEASIGSTGTTVVSDDHYSETKWAAHKKLVCRKWRTAFQLLQLAAEDESCPAAADRRCLVRGTFAQLAENSFRCFCTNVCNRVSLKSQHPYMIIRFCFALGFLFAAAQNKQIFIALVISHKLLNLAHRAAITTCPAIAAMPGRILQSRRDIRQMTMYRTPSVAIAAKI